MTTTTVSITLHAGMRDRAGSEQITVTLTTSEADADAILSAVAEQHPDLAAYCRVSRVAVGDRFIREAVAVSATSAIDIIPPVSGG